MLSSCLCQFSLAKDNGEAISSIRWIFGNMGISYRHKKGQLLLAFLNLEASTGVEPV